MITQAILKHAVTDFVAIEQAGSNRPSDDSTSSDRTSSHRSRNYRLK